MKKFYDFLISNFLARYIFLLTLIITIVSLFGNIAVSEFPKPMFFVKTCSIFIIPLLLNVLFEILSKNIISNLQDTSDVLNILNHRFGSQISLRTFDDKEIDNIHKYNLVYRQDQLNFGCTVIIIHLED